MEHTKGKWYLKPEDEVIEVTNSYSLDVYNDNIRVCLVNVWGNSEDEVKANSKLISKSPEMLEALKYELQFLDIVYSRIDYPGARHLKDIRHDINARKKQIESLLK